MDSASIVTRPARFGALDQFNSNVSWPHNSLHDNLRLNCPVYHFGRLGGLRGFQLRKVVEHADGRLLTIGKMPRLIQDNPYEPPQAPSETPAQARSRFHEWLVDRLMLVGCGCLSFVIVWGVAMLVIFVLNSRW